MLAVGKKQFTAITTSLTIHLIAAIALATITYTAQQFEALIPIETIMDEERIQEEFSQELDVATEASENMAVVAGGVVTGAMGGSEAPAVAQKNIEESQSLQEPDVKVNIGPMDIAGIQDLGTDLGEGEVTGEVGAAVDGYGTALSRITQEIVRHMREKKVLVVWLFDESDSMKDDQQEIKKQFHVVYDELGIVQEKDQDLKKNRKTDEILETMIFGFGAKLHQLMKAPTSDIKEVRKAIDKIEIDESGLENTCQSVSAVIDQFGPIARREKRQLMIVVVTDESGNDGQNIDATVEKAKKFNAPCYILGREAVFGYPYARLRWKDPKFGLDHWLRIDRGPETPFPEALQFDGLHERWDAYSSGFGPYEQVLLAKESGGIFFVLPGEEENLIGQEAIERRKFQFYDLKEYTPTLEPRRTYVEERTKSKFRDTLWKVIMMLNPHVDPELQIQEHHYPFEPQPFQAASAVSFRRGVRALGMLNTAAEELEKIKPLRAKEESTRWRANYDLILGQIYAYRVRLFQALLALDKHGKAMPKAKNPTSNEWHLRRVPQMLTPDPQVVKATKVTPEELVKQEKLARELLKDVSKNHPRTPWSNRAEYELAVGFGMDIIEGYRDPRYRNLTGIKFPKP